MFHPVYSLAPFTDRLRVMCRIPTVRFMLLLCNIDYLHIPDIVGATTCRPPTVYAEHWPSPRPERVPRRGGCGDIIGAKRPEIADYVC